MPNDSHSIKIDYDSASKTFSYEITTTFGNPSLPSVTGPGDEPVVKKDSEVSWTCNKGDFGVLFKDGKWPFSGNADLLSAAKNTSTLKQTVRGLGPKEKKPKSKRTFSYSVFIHVGGSEPIVFDDPDLVLDDGGGGGGDSQAQEQ